MPSSQLLAGQLGNPTGLLGGLAGLVWNRRNAALNDTVLALLSLQPADRVLDIGFGGGYLLDRMSATVTEGLLAGVDISAAMVAKAERRYQTHGRAGIFELRCASAEALPYPDGHFTKVCSVNSIFYWQYVDQALREITRVLMDAGQLVLCYTSKESLEKKGFARHISLIDTHLLAEMVRATGLQEPVITIHSDRHRNYVCMTARKAAQSNFP